MFSAEVRCTYHRKAAHHNIQSYIHQAKYNAEKTHSICSDVGYRMTGLIKLGARAARTGGPEYSYRGTMGIGQSINERQHKVQVQMDLNGMSFFRYSVDISAYS